MDRASHGERVEGRPLAGPCSQAITGMRLGLLWPGWSVT